ncbi:MAG TPA: BtpA/SgcQ family protein [Acidobacteriota bacterium]|nr:BtpA/SgcQ family protein [Acidobacteriota bacterium]
MSSQLQKFRSIFENPKPIIGMIALPPMLGYPEFTSLYSVIERALGDLDTLQKGGVDGVCLENDYDRPHVMTVGPEVVASFTCVAQEVAKHANVPVGLEVLLNDWRASLAIAKVIDARFVRLDFFVDRVRIAAGVVEPEPEAVLAYRKKIQAESVALFTDIQVKYSELLEPNKPLGVSAKQAIASGSDGLIVSGTVTGEWPTLADLLETREAAGDVPVLVGSGTSPQNVRDLFQYADGAIVGTSLKNSMASHELILAERVRHLMEVVEEIRTKNS